MFINLIEKLNYEAGAGRLGLVLGPSPEPSRPPKPLCSLGVFYEVYTDTDTATDTYCPAIWNRISECA